MRIRLAGILLAAWMLGCQPDNATPSLVLHSINVRRDLCDGIAGHVAGAWEDAFKYGVGLENYIALALAGREARALSAAASVHEFEIQKLMTTKGENMKPEVRSALIEASTQVEALCSVAKKPAGLSLVTFSAKVTDLRTELDRALARASMLSPGTAAPSQTAQVDAAAREAAQRVQ